jgi:hypothetical protein
VRIYYERHDPRQPRLSFWKSDIGGFVAMAIWIVGIIIVTVLLKFLFAVL